MKILLLKKSAIIVCMSKERFITFIFGTAIEALFFSISMFGKDWLFAVVFGLFLLRRLMLSYKLDKFMRENKIL